MNNKGSTFAIWIELVLFIIVMIGALTFIGLDLNDRYSQNHDLTLGLNVSNQLSSLNDFKKDAVNDSLQGQSSLSDYGIMKLLTTPKILMQTLSILWSFVDGSFITTVVNAMQLGAIGSTIAVVFRILYVITLVFIVLKLVLRINI